MNEKNDRNKLESYRLDFQQFDYWLFQIKWMKYAKWRGKKHRKWIGYDKFEFFFILKFEKNKKT